MSDPVDRTMFMHLASKKHCEIASQMAGDILDVISASKDTIPTALVVGVLEIVKADFVRDAILAAQEVGNDNN